MIEIKQRKMLKIILMMVAVLVCLASFAVCPSFVAAAENTTLSDDYEAFNSDLMQMFEEETVATAYSLDEEKPLENRLIVVSDQNLSSHGAKRQANYKTYHIFQYENQQSTQEAYQYFQNLDCVDAVSYDYVVHAEGWDEEVSADASYTFQSWGYYSSADYVGVNAYLSSLADFGGLSTELTVAVLDSGIFPEHEIFDGRIQAAYARNFTTESSTTSCSYKDLNSHGTHVSGTIAEATPSNVKILPLKVLDSTGEGYVSWIINAINYATSIAKQINLKVLNMSLGVGEADSVPSEVRAASSQTLSDAIRSATAEGVACVVSAGNKHQDTANVSPANIDEAITVSALKRVSVSLTEQKLSFDGSYSNYGNHVDFAAPGTNIYSASHIYPDKYVPKKGTSMAAPHVSACVALAYLNPKYSGFKVSEMVNLLRENADRSQLITTTEYASKPNASGWDKYYGYGVINVANLGISYVGELQSASTETSSGKNIKLTYTEPLQTGDTLKIYYTTDEYASTVDVATDNLYHTSGISITETTKITAVAVVTNASGKIVQKSKLFSEVFYLADRDLDSNFEFALFADGYKITKYNGALSKLDVKQKINSKNIVAVGEYAFNNSPVTELNLPSTIKIFDANAFKGNGKLTSIKCASNAVSVEDAAFRECTALSVFDVQNITSIANNAFVGCNALVSLSLPKVTSIGNNAFYDNAIQNVFIGDQLTQIGDLKDSQTSLKRIYGYENTPAKTFADEYSIEFVDMTLRVTNKEVLAQKYVRTNEVLEFEVSVAGYMPQTTVNYANASGFIGNKGNLTQTITGGDLTKSVKIKIQGYDVGKYNFSLTLSDGLGNTVKTSNMLIVVVSQTNAQIAVNFSVSNIYVLVNNTKITSGTKLYANQDYSISVGAEEGFSLQRVKINDVWYSSSQLPLSLSNVTSDINISSAEVQTLQELPVNMNFDREKGDIMVENQNVNEGVNVGRHENLTFMIQPKEGYVVKSVKLNGADLTPNQDDVYVVEDVTTSLDIAVEFKEAYYNLKISLGNGGTLTTVGGDGNKIAHGSDRTFHIGAYEGYEVDFVSINGQMIDLSQNTFSLENIQKDYDIVVSFKEAKAFGGENKLILYYFLVMAGIFVTFVVARVVLFFVRKKKKS